MLSQDFTAVDLNPATWGNLGIIADMLQPWERILYVLHDKGRIINVFHPERGLVNDIEIDPLCPKQYADRILAENSCIDSVWICDKNSLINYFCRVNEADISNCETDVFMSHIYMLLNNFQGIDIFGRGNGYIDIYGKVRQYAASEFPPDCTIALGIFKEARLFFDAVLGFEKHKLKLITTFDHFKGGDFSNEILMQDLNDVKDIIEAKTGGPVFAYFMDQADFAEKIGILRKSI